MSRSLDRPTKDCFSLVRFQYGDPSNPSYIAFTNWSFNIPGNPVYTSEPRLELSVPENNGTLQPVYLDVFLPMSNSWFANIVSGIPLAPVKIQAAEFTKPTSGGDISTLRKFFRGELDRTIKNYQGRADRSVARFNNIKHRLDIPLGLQANAQCIWTLFGSGCLKGKTGYSNFLVVDTVDGKILTTTTSPSRTGKFFHRGYLEYQGLRIGIRDWNDSAADTFYLVKMPPKSWEGKMITAWAGCDKTIETCRARFDNEIQFCAPGYAMPSYNALIENAG